MSLSPFNSFQSQFVTYLLNFPRMFRVEGHCYFGVFNFPFG